MGRVTETTSSFRTVLVAPALTRRTSLALSSTAREA
jgi:hypothetical protein